MRHGALAHRNRRKRMLSIASLLVVFIVGICLLQSYVMWNTRSFSSHLQIPSPTTSMLQSKKNIQNITTFTSQSTSSPSSPRWAYVFLLADCDPNNPTYHGLFYNVLAATYVLKYRDTDDEDTVNNNGAMGYNRTRRKSKADIVVLVQMSHRTSDEHLPIHEETLLSKMNILIEYLPKVESSRTVNNDHDSPISFYELVMAKFYIFDMIEYSKIMFLDGDVLPLCNLDYLMELSTTMDANSTTATVLGDTVLHAMYEDPVNAGVFVITPRASMSQKKVMKLWQQHKKNEILSSSSPSPIPSIKYRLWNGQNGTGWEFYCGEYDQGLLLFLARVIDRHSASIIVGSTIEHYAAIPSASNDINISMTEGDLPFPNKIREPSSIVSSDFLSKYSCLANPLSAKEEKTASTTEATNKDSVAEMDVLGGTWAQNANTQAAQLPVYRDFFHMVGYSKAWENPPKSWHEGNGDMNQPPQSQMSVSSLTTSRDYWYYVVNQVAERFDPHRTVIPTHLERLPSIFKKGQIRGDLLFVVDPKTGP